MFCTFNSLLIKITNAIVIKWHLRNNNVWNEYVGIMGWLGGGEGAIAYRVLNDPEQTSFCCN